MLGPVLTAASTGNVLQTGLSYGANLTIEEATGKNPTKHIIDYKAKKIIDKDLKNLLKKHIKLTRKKILLRKKN